MPIAAPAAQRCVAAADVLAAADRIRPYAHRTPVLRCTALDRWTGAELHFKCENLQRVGAFKFRGACNAVMALSDEEAARGVVTHSSGNHGAALALAAHLRGIRANVVMPSNSPRIKCDAVAGYGGRITLCEPTPQARTETADRIVAERGGVLVHPFDHPHVIAGQGTAALELLAEVPDLDAVIAPVGGGGLLAGTAIACRHHSPTIRVLAAEPAAVDDAARSLASGRRETNATTATIADGLRTPVGVLTFPIVRDLVERVVTVTEDEIRSAFRHVLERMNILIEPSCAVPVAALLSDRLDVSGLKVGVILTGGNIDLRRIPELIGA